MTKIKHFRIQLRAREIARWLKNQHQMPTTPDLETAIEGAIARLKPKAETAAIYTTMTRGTAEKATPIAFPDKAVAVSLVAATIGPELSRYRQSLSAETDSLEVRLVEAIEHEALHQSVQFAIRLLSDQAKGEECDVTAPIPTEDTQLLSPLVTLLGSQRIGVDADGSHPLPGYSRVVWTFWTPVVKAGRRSESSRGQKAAA